MSRDRQPSELTAANAAHQAALLALLWALSTMACSYWVGAQRQRDWVGWQRCQRLHLATQARPPGAIGPNTTGTAPALCVQAMAVVSGALHCQELSPIPVITASKAVHSHGSEGVTAKPHRQHLPVWSPGTPDATDVPCTALAAASAAGPACSHADCKHDVGAKLRPPSAGAVQASAAPSAGTIDATVAPPPTYSVLPAGTSHRAVEPHATAAEALPTPSADPLPPYTRYHPSCNVPSAVKPAPRSYHPFLRHHVTHVKLQGVEPSMIQPGYQERLRELVHERTGRWLSHVYVREGCIELVLDCEEWGSGITTRGSPASSWSQGDSLGPAGRAERDVGEREYGGAAESGRGGGGSDGIGGSSGGRAGGSEQRSAGSGVEDGGSGARSQGSAGPRTLKAPHELADRRLASSAVASPANSAAATPSARSLRGPSLDQPAGPGTRSGSVQGQHIHPAAADLFALGAGDGSTHLTEPLDGTAGALGTWDVVRALQLLPSGGGGDGDVGVCSHTTGDGGGGIGEHGTAAAAAMSPSLLEGSTAAGASANAGTVLSWALHDGGSAQESGAGSARGGPLATDTAGLGLTARASSGSGGGNGGTVQTAAPVLGTSLSIEGQATTRPLCDSTACRAMGLPRIVSLEPRVLRAGPVQTRPGVGPGQQPPAARASAGAAPGGTSRDGGVSVITGAIGAAGTGVGMGLGAAQSLPLTLKAVIRCNPQLLTGEPLELLVRSEGRYLPALVISNGLVPPPGGDDDAVGGDADGRLSYDIELPLMAGVLPPRPGIMLVDLRVQDVPVHVAPVVVVADPDMAVELAAALANARLPDDDRDSLLMDLGTWGFHAEEVKARKARDAARDGSRAPLNRERVAQHQQSGSGSPQPDPSLQPNLSPQQQQQCEQQEHPDARESPAAMATEGTVAAVSVNGDSSDGDGTEERLGLLGLHLLKYALSAGWWHTAASLAADMIAIGFKDGGPELQAAAAAAEAVTAAAAAATAAAAAATSPSSAVLQAPVGAGSPVAPQAVAVVNPASSVEVSATRAVVATTVPTGAECRSEMSSTGQEPKLQPERWQASMVTAASHSVPAEVAAPYADGGPQGHGSAEIEAAVIPYGASMDATGPAGRQECLAMMHHSGVSGSRVSTGARPIPLTGRNLWFPSLLLRGGRQVLGPTGPAAVSSSAESPSSGTVTAATAIGISRGVFSCRFRAVRTRGLAVASASGGICVSSPPTMVMDSRENGASSSCCTEACSMAAAAAAATTLAADHDEASVPVSSWDSWGALRVVLGMTRVSPAEEAAYQVYAAPRMASQGYVIMLLDLMALATLLYKSCTNLGVAQARVILLACWVAVLEVVAALVTRRSKRMMWAGNRGSGIGRNSSGPSTGGRGGTWDWDWISDWPRLHEVCKLLRYVSYMVTKILCAMDIVEMPRGVDSYLLGVALLVQEGLVHPISCLMSLHLLSFLTLVRATANFMLMVQVDARFQGGRLGPVGCGVWAAAISSTEWLVSVMLHVYFRVSYSRWAANKHAKAHQ